MENIEVQKLTGIQNLYRYPGVEVIDNFLNVGEKLMITGTRLSCKTSAALQLAVAVAEGWDWLNFDVVKGKVLYVNLGMNDIACMYRVNEIYKSYGLDKSESLENIHFLNLRGKGIFDAKSLVDFLIRYTQDNNYKMIIIDSLDDVININRNQTVLSFNSPYDQLAMLNQELNRLTEMANTSIAYTHTRQVTFDKTVPNSLYDAVVNFNFINKAIEENKIITNWEASFMTRNYPLLHQSKFFRFEYPNLEIDNSIGERLKKVNEYKKKESYKKVSSGIKKANQSRSNKSQLELETAFNALSEDGQSVEVMEIANHLNIKRQSVYRKVKKHNNFYISDGDVKKVIEEVSPPKQDSDKNLGTF
ncbi:AAA family ATPase [Vagococcus entomophilus]|uniref:Uncharacterized protein n=1 Tax=Vagococcus entomophilus TaxID=1160095 RepID=A0A430AHF7_9ENTE|nr:AAA family ATPase [Vagococcus entomophilus]RSU07284.1 hypothetical protein CBF30_08510 [Vagococcus entomophilus]